MNHKSAKRVKVGERGSGGLESFIDGIAYCVFFYGFIMVVITMFMELLSFWLKVAAAAQYLLGALVFFALLKGLAELIRLSQKRAGLTYGGEISTVEVSSIYACSACDAEVYNASQCYHCGAVLDNEDLKD